MTYWTNCTAVECNPRKISGAWAFTGTRVPVYALFENLEAGATVKQFMDNDSFKNWLQETVFNLTYTNDEAT